MTDLWKSNGAEALRIALIHFASEDSEVDVEVFVENFLKTGWIKLRGKYPEINKIKTKNASAMMIFKPSSDKIYIFISSSNVGLTNISKVFEKIIIRLTPDEFKYPRASDFNYEREDWKNWISFQNMMYFDFWGIHDYRSYNSHFWIRRFRDVSAKLIPQDQPDQIMAAYRALGF